MKSKAKSATLLFLGFPPRNHSTNHYIWTHCSASWIIYQYHTNQRYILYAGISSTTIWWRILAFLWWLTHIAKLHHDCSSLSKAVSKTYIWLKAYLFDDHLSALNQKNKAHDIIFLCVKWGWRRSVKKEYNSKVIGSSIDLYYLPIADNLYL